MSVSLSPHGTNQVIQRKFSITQVRPALCEETKRGVPLWDDGDKINPISLSAVFYLCVYKRTGFDERWLID